MRQRMRFLSRFGLNQLDKDFYHFGLKMVGERYLVFRSMNFSKTRVLFAANLRRSLTASCTHLPLVFFKSTKTSSWRRITKRAFELKPHLSLQNPLFNTALSYFITTLYIL